MYYTPNGQSAVVVAERLHRLDFREPHSMALIDSVPVPCRGVDHMDFTADGRFLIASCEFSGMVIKMDVATRTVVGTLALPLPGSKASILERMPGTFQFSRLSKSKCHI